MAFANTGVFYLRSTFTSAAVGGTRIAALADVADGAGSVTTTTAHTSNAATRRVVIPYQSSSIAAPSSAYGFSINPADMGGAVGARRFFPAGTHTPIFWAAGGNLLGNNTFRVTAYRVGVSPGFTKTQIGSTASVAVGGSLLGALVSIPLVLPEIIFEPGETILYAPDAECNPGVLAGNISFVFGTGDVTQGNTVSRITTPRLGVLADAVGAATGGSDAVGVPGLVVPATGSSLGACTVDAFAASVATTIGVSQGSSTVDGFAATVAGTIGVAAGTSEAQGRAAAVIGAVGSVDIGGGGGNTTIVRRPTFVFGN